MRERRTDENVRALILSCATDGGCWEWTGYRRASGYGGVTFRGRTTTAHRAAYELLVGQIPKGLHIDHLCRNRACVNPAHLEPVTPLENLRRSDAATGARTARTHCPLGHPYDEANTYVSPTNRRICRECQRNRELRRTRRVA